jgi:hypothetical protein
MYFGLDTQHNRESCPEPCISIETQNTTGGVTQHHVFPSRHTTQQEELPRTMYFHRDTKYNRRSYPAPCISVETHNTTGRVAQHHEIHKPADGTTHLILESQNRSTAVSTSNFKHLMMMNVSRNM